MKRRPTFLETRKKNKHQKQLIKNKNLIYSKYQYHEKIIHLIELKHIKEINAKIKKKQCETKLLAD